MLSLVSLLRPRLIPLKYALQNYRRHDHSGRKTVTDKMLRFDVVANREPNAQRCSAKMSHGHYSATASSLLLLYEGDYADHCFSRSFSFDLVVLLPPRRSRRHSIRQRHAHTRLVAGTCLRFASLETPCDVRRLDSSNALPTRCLRAPFNIFFYKQAGKRDNLT